MGREINMENVKTDCYKEIYGPKRLLKGKQGGNELYDNSMTMA